MGHSLQPPVKTFEVLMEEHSREVWDRLKRMDAPAREQPTPAPPRRDRTDR